MSRQRIEREYLLKTSKLTWVHAHVLKEYLESINSNVSTIKVEPENEPTNNTDGERDVEAVNTDIQDQKDKENVCKEDGKIYQYVNLFHMFGVRVVLSAVDLNEYRDGSHAAPSRNDTNVGYTTSSVDSMCSMVNVLEECFTINEHTMRVEMENGETHRTEKVVCAHSTNEDSEECHIEDVVSVAIDLSHMSRLQVHLVDMNKHKDSMKMFAVHHEVSPLPHNWKKKFRDKFSAQNSCPVCHKQCHDLKLHMRSHNGEKPYSCPQCEMAFSNSGNLGRHIRIMHHGERPFTCDVCSRTFTDSGNLNKHKRSVHSSARPFSCGICETTFKLRCTLKKHLKLIHSGVPVHKPYSCRDCHKEFDCPSKLKAHAYVHTGEKLYGCTECSAMFSTKGYLVLHKRVHSGEKPYTCELCKKKFSMLGNLKSHLRTHSGEKPFVCTYENCGKAFAHSGNLSAHILTHEGDQKFPCSSCSRIFRSRPGLKYHAGKCSGK